MEGMDIKMVTIIILPYEWHRRPEHHRTPNCFHLLKLSPYKSNEFARRLVERGSFFRLLLFLTDIINHMNKIIIKLISLLKYMKF